MSIEAQALTQLLLEIEKAGNSPIGDHDFVEIVDWAQRQAKYWVQPLQAHMNVASDVWVVNEEWSRDQLLAHCKDLPNLWVLRCLCLGNLNFNVEVEGFLGWAKEGFATEVDWECLIECATRLKTPVGGNVLAIFLAVRNCLESPGFNSDDTDAMEDCIGDLSVFTKSYMSLRYDFLVQVEAMIRADVPTLHRRPLIVVR